MTGMEIIVALFFVALIGLLINRRSGVPPGFRLIVNIVLALIVAGVALWLINTYIPMAGSIKAILNLVVFIACCVGVLRAVGLWDSVVRMWDNLTHRTSS